MPIEDVAPGGSTRGRRQVGNWMMDESDPVDGDQLFLEHLTKRAKQRNRSHAIKSPIMAVLRRYGVQQQLTSQSMEAIWTEIVGPVLAKESRTGKIDRGVMLVAVANSSVLQELSLRKLEILDRLHQHETWKEVRDLKFRREKFDSR